MPTKSKSKKIVKKAPAKRARSTRTKGIWTISKTPTFSRFSLIGLSIILLQLITIYMMIPGYSKAQVSADPSWNWLTYLSTVNIGGAKCPANSFTIPPTINEGDTSQPVCVKLAKKIIYEKTPSRISGNIATVDQYYGSGMATAVKAIKADFHDYNVFGIYDTYIDARMWQILAYIANSGYTPNASNAPTGPTSGGCVNAFSGESWQLARPDRGQDFIANGNQPVKAMCDGVIKSIYGWSDVGSGTFISYKLTAAPGGHSELLGKCIYAAEYITPAAGLYIGKQVRAGDVLGTATGRDTEWGFSSGPGQANSAKIGSGASEQSTDAGRAFGRLVIYLGGHVRDDPGPGPLYAGSNCP